jgi:hypothetical protein
VAAFKASILLYKPPVAASVPTIKKLTTELPEFVIGPDIVGFVITVLPFILDENVAEQDVELFLFTDLSLHWLTAPPLCVIVVASAPSSQS